MALVRVATHRANGREVAVKCIRSDDTELRQFTRDEYALMRSLRHPSIVQVYDLYEDHHSLWLCMELCSGGSVEQHVESLGVFHGGVATALFAQLLQGVDFLHSKRIVHRDLKPANLLLQGHDEAAQKSQQVTPGRTPRALLLKISDFNSAKQIGRGPGSSLMLTDRGTHLYAAPELRFGCMWNERVDVWACGLCMYFMLRGELPFNVTQRSVSKSLLSGKLPSIRWDSVPSLMKNLLQQCLAVRMHDRPPAMELLLHPIFEDTEPRQWGHVLSDREEEPNGACDEPSDIFALRPACGLVAVAFQRHQVANPPSPRLSLLTPRALSSPLIAFGERAQSFSEGRWGLSFLSLRHLALRKSELAVSETAV